MKDKVEVCASSEVEETRQCTLGIGVRKCPNMEASLFACVPSPMDVFRVEVIPPPRRSFSCLSCRTRRQNVA